MNKSISVLQQEKKNITHMPPSSRTFASDMAIQHTRCPCTRPHDDLVPFGPTGDVGGSQGSNNRQGAGDLQRMDKRKAKERGLYLSSINIYNKIDLTRTKLSRIVV